LDIRSQESQKEVQIQVQHQAARDLGPNRRRLGAQIFVTRLEDIEVEEAALEDSFAAAVQPIAGLFSGAADEHFVRRTHVRGTVTWQMPGRFLMADRTGVAFVATGTAPIPVGDTVDVVGFPGGGDYGLTLSDAEVRKAAGPPNAGKAVPALVPAIELLNRPPDGKVVRLKARLIEQTTNADEHIFLLSDGSQRFRAALRHAGSDHGIVSLPRGSILELTGVVIPRNGSSPAMSPFFLVASPADIVVKEGMGWLTSKKVLGILVCMSVVVLGALVWVALLKRSLLASVSFSRRLVRPMLRLQPMAGGIAEADLSARASMRDAQEIERLAQSFNTMADSLLQRDEILESVRFAAQRFLSAAAWQTVIVEVLAKIGNAAQVSRVFLLENRSGQQEGLVGTVLHEWIRPGIACQTRGPGPAELHWAGGDCNQWNGALGRGELVSVEAGDPASGTRCGPVPPPFSSILVPIEVGGKWFGALGFDDCVRARAWSDAELDSFRSAAGMLGAAITRQQAQEYVDNILRSMGESLLVMDPEMRIQRVNPSALRLLGYTEEQLVGQPVSQVVEGGVPVSGVAIERTYRTKSGNRIPVLFSCAELRSGPGSLVGYVCLAQDVTDLKRAQAELVLARDAAENTNRAKSVFLANMSHELRTPLNAIIGYSQMLREDCIGPEQPEVLSDLEKIERSGHILLGIINDILDLSKVEAGRETVKPQSIDVAAVLQDVSNAVQPLVRQQGNVLEIDCPEHARLAYADLPKFRQSVLNLVNNALKFTERGRVSVVVNKLRSGDREWTEVHVSDTGIGIGREHLGKLFQPFSQVDGSATRKYNGTGLGLAISKKFCQMMGGDITVESEPGRGSRFSIRVPAGRDVGQTSSPAEVGQASRPVREVGTEFENVPDTVGRR
jgi:PAS domain S-box-containing protein